MRMIRSASWYSVFQFWEIGSDRLRNIEDPYDSESGQHGLLRFRCVFFTFIFLAAPVADDRSENLNSFLAFLHIPAKLIPCANARYSLGVRLLSDYQQNVPETVGMELRHCSEVGGKHFALASLQLLDEKVHGLLNNLLRGVVGGIGTLLVR
jgi:hypothetical protein